MTIVHHLDDATIIAFAAGTLDESLSIVATCHVTWCSDCRDAMHEAERAGGELMAEIEPSELSDGCRAQTLSRLDQAALYRLPVQSKANGELPGPLARLLGWQDLKELAWRKPAPGVAMFDIKLSPGAHGRLHLLRVAPGLAIPEHGHRGGELTLVLSGAYRDAFGRFDQGDVADLDEGVEHRPKVDGEEPCICLIAAEAPARFKSILARIMQSFLRI